MPLTMFHRLGVQLGLDPRGALAWSGRVDALKVSIEAPSHRGFSAWIVCRHAIPLRLALRLSRGDDGDSDGEVASSSASEPWKTAGHEALALRAVDRATARAMLRNVREALAPLGTANALVLDDASLRVLATPLATSADVDRLDAMARCVVVLSRRLSEERTSWETAAETEIAPSWAQLAAEMGLPWDPDHSRIAGDLGLATFDARIGGEPDLLYTRARTKWPSIGRGLSATWPVEKGAVDTVTSTLSGPARHALESLRRMDATVVLDDRRLVARVERVVSGPDIGRLVRDVVTVTKSIVGPSNDVSPYR